MPRVDFFISFAEPDREWAEWIATILMDGDYRVVVGHEPIGIPTAGRREMIADANMVICVLTPAYIASSYAQKEWFRAYLEGPRGLLPILVEEAPIPPLLETALILNWVGLDKTQAANSLRSFMPPKSAKPTESPKLPERPGARLDNARTKVFISYSHEDRAWLDRLLVFLRPLEREGKLDIWEDRKLLPGMKWRDEIDAALSKCKIAIPLISSDFLASNFILDEELPKMLQRAESEGVAVMPVILRPSRFERSGLISEFQSVNPPSSPLSGLRRHQWEKVFADFADVIEDTLGRRN